MKRMIVGLKLDKLHDLEHFERLELAIMVYQRIIDKINLMKDDYHICKRNYDQLKQKYIAKHDEAILEMQIFLDQKDQSNKLVYKALALHALWIEKQYLTEMFEYNECNESLYMHLLDKIERQTLRVEKWEPQLTPKHLKKKRCKKKWPWLERLISMLNRTEHKEREHYVIARTQFIISTKVIESLQQLQAMDFGYNPDLITPIIDLYIGFQTQAQEKMSDLSLNKPYLINEVNKVLLNKWLMKTEERIVKDFWKKEMITDKLYKHFMLEVEEEILKNI